MVLLIDANVVLDVLLKRENFYKDSSTILKLCEIKKVKGYLSTLSFPNLIYIMRKELKPRKIEEVLKTLSLICDFVELNKLDLMRASKLNWDDFEDALQYITAKKIKADYIVTRNIKDFKKSKIQAITPSDFIKLF